MSKKNDAENDMNRHVASFQCQCGLTKDGAAVPGLMLCARCDTGPIALETALPRTEGE